MADTGRWTVGSLGGSTCHAGRHERRLVGARSSSKRVRVLRTRALRRALVGVLVVVGRVRGVVASVRVECVRHAGVHRRRSAEVLRIALILHGSHGLRRRLRRAVPTAVVWRAGRTLRELLSHAGCAGLIRHLPVALSGRPHVVVVLSRRVSTATASLGSKVRTRAAHVAVSGLGRGSALVHRLTGSVERGLTLAGVATHAAKAQTVTLGNRWRTSTAGSRLRDRRRRVLRLDHTVAFLLRRSRGGLGLLSSAGLRTFSVHGAEVDGRPASLADRSTVLCVSARACGTDDHRRFPAVLGRGGCAARHTVLCRLGASLRSRSRSVHRGLGRLSIARGSCRSRGS